MLYLREFGYSDLRLRCHVIGGHQRRRVLVRFLILLKLLKSLTQTLIHAHVLTRYTNVLILYVFV